MLLKKKKKSLQPQLFGNSSEQTALETQLEENDQTGSPACAVVQYGPNAVLKLEKTFLIREEWTSCSA